MKLKTMAFAAALIAAPALAQTAPPSDTLQEVISKGVTITVAQMSVTGDVVYKPDGTFSGFEGQYEGTYKVDGSKLCISAPAVGQDNSCIEYPAGKKSGDKFKVTDATVGELEITIK